MTLLRVQKAMTPEEMDAQATPCEAPGCLLAPRRDQCFSYISAMLHMHLGNRVYSMHPCAQVQHWCCSHEHATLAIKACIDEHHSADLLEVNDALHPKHVQLPAHLTHCAIASCPNALTDECYSLAIDYAVPGPGKGAYICDPHPHWCCSEAHAKLAAVACIDEHLEKGDHA